MANLVFKGLKIIERYKYEGDIHATADNVVIEPTVDMDCIEFWENRLSQLGIPYVLAINTKREFSILSPGFNRAHKEVKEQVQEDYEEFELYTTHVEDENEYVH